MNQRGVSTIGLVFFGSIIFCIGYAAWQIIPFFYYHAELQGLAEYQAKKGNLFRDDQIKKTFMKEVRKFNVPVEEDALQINRFSGQVVIHLEYSEVFYVDLTSLGYGVYDIWEFPFVVHGEGIVEEKKKRR